MTMLLYRIRKLWDVLRRVPLHDPYARAFGDYAPNAHIHQPDDPGRKGE